MTDTGSLSTAWGVPMNRQHAKDTARALELLGCTEVGILNPGPRSFHVVGKHQAVGQVYLIDVNDAQKKIVELTHLIAGR